MLSKDLIAASAKPLILGILSEGESYGYAIIQRIRKLSEDRIVWTDGMLYPVLHRMERDNWIQSEWRLSDTGRKRKYYHLSDKGKRAMAEELDQWITVTETFKKLWNTPSLSHFAKP